MQTLFEFEKIYTNILFSGWKLKQCEGFDEDLMKRPNERALKLEGFWVFFFGFI
jgi:hypothetical protein